MPDAKIVWRCRLEEANPNLVQVEVDTKEYKRAVAKIAYELACEWIGTEDLEDPVGEKIRRYVIDPSFTVPPIENAVNGRIGFRPIRDLCKLLNYQPFNHVGRIRSSEGVLVCHISIFNIILGSIIVSDTPERYEMFVPQGVEIEPTTGKRQSLS